MGSFRYEVLQKDGKIRDGTLEGASSRREAAVILGEKGWRVLSLEEVAEAKTRKRASAPTSLASSEPKDAGGKTRSAAPPENRMGSRHLIQFTEELSDLLSAGVPLDGALGSIGKRSESPVIRRVALRCHERVRDGAPLASALRNASTSFDNLYCNLVSAGEVSGALGEILKRQVLYLTTLEELKGKLATAMIYPAFLLMSGAAVSAMFVFFLLPKLRDLVDSTGGTLPPVARLLLESGDFLKSYWGGLLAAFAVLLVVGAVLCQRESTKRAWDEFALKLPLIGRILKTRFNVQFVETLSNLLSNGLPLVKSLELVEATTPNRHMRAEIESMTRKVAEGALLHRSMEKAGVFEPGLVDMVRIGEDTGRLASSMAKAGARLDREFGRSIDRIASVIQPAIILVMAFVVGVMAYMMISVVYETISVLRSR